MKPLTHFPTPSTASSERWTATSGRRPNTFAGENAPGGRVPPQRGCGRWFAGTFALLLASPAAFAAAPTKPALNEARVAQHYAIGKIPTPVGVDPQIGGLAALPDGRIAACFHHGEVAIFNPAKNEWKLFAEGLQEPLGLIAAADGSLLVMQRPELTRLRDTDGDGVADRYETVWDGFGMTGNYHEFAFGPARGPNGKLYVGLNLASSGASVREEIRGAWSDVGLPREEFYAGEWSGKKTAAAGRMYSRVPYRGWVVEIDETTGAATPFASGFRSPDGLGFDAAGNLFVNDNQGDWRGTSPVHVVTRDGFYGHPASLVWRRDWKDGDPLQVPIEKLEALRTKPAINIPFASYANSPTQMLLIPRTAAWGALGGQLLMGEMNSPRLLRLLPEETDGVWQGACVFLAETEALKAGLHRLAFVGDTLYLGRTHLSWAGAEGIGTLKPTGKTPFDPLTMRVTPRGFRFEFTAPLAASAAEPARWAGQRYYYSYHAAYGSPEREKAEFAATKVTLSNGGRTAEIAFADGEMKPGFIYDFDLARVESAVGEAPLNARIAYTLNRVPR